MESSNAKILVRDYLLENCKVKDLPEEIIEKQTDFYIYQIVLQSEDEEGTSESLLQDYLESYGYKNEEELRENLQTSSKDIMKEYIIYDPLQKREIFQ